MTEQSLSTKQYKNLFETGEDAVLPYRLFHLLCSFWLLIYVAAILQNFIGSSFNSSSFYLSESALFNTFWLFFIPLSAFVILAIKNYHHLFLEIKSNSSVWLAGVVSSIILGLLHLTIFSATIYAISRLTFYHTFDFSWMINETFTEDFYLVFSVYGLILFMITGYYRRSEKRIQTKSDTSNFVETLSVRKGKKLIPIKINDIRWIDTDHPYIAIHTGEHTYLHSSSLTNILKKLDPEQFARIHRSCIINLDTIVDLTSRLNGDYDIKLEDGTILRMSRTYSQEVKDKLL